MRQGLALRSVRRPPRSRRSDTGTRSLAASASRHGRAQGGIEPEIVARATALDLGGGIEVAVAQAEDLVAMKVLSVSDARLQDRIDLQHLLVAHPALDLHAVRAEGGAFIGAIYAEEEKAQAAGLSADALVAHRQQHIGELQLILHHG